MNNEIGVPLTLFKIGGSTKFVVLEMGAAKSGDIEYLAKVAQPDIGVITCCAPAHLENLQSLRNIAHTKGALVSNLPFSGTAVLNSEDVFFSKWTKMNASDNMISFGDHGECFSSEESIKADSTSFCLNLRSASIKLEIKHVGRHNIKNALAAAAASFALGVSMQTIVDGLIATPKILGRLFWIRGKQLNILDDSYNANPKALKAAIDTLCSEQGEKWVVLGDMLELGPSSQKLHNESVIQMNKLDISRLFALGRYSVKSTRYFEKKPENFSDIDNLIKRLKCLIAESETKVSILIKGSRALNLNLVVDALKEANI